MAISPRLAIKSFWKGILVPPGLAIPCDRIKHDTQGFSQCFECSDITEMASLGTHGATSVHYRHTRASFVRPGSGALASAGGPCSPCN
jgi:hypothetical protein